MELNRALPAARIAMRQMSLMRATEQLEKNAASGYRFQHIGSYSGRQEPDQRERGQERIPAQGDPKNPERMDETAINRQGVTGQGVTGQIKEKAHQLKEAVKDQAQNLKETIKEKTGMGSKDSIIRDSQQKLSGETYEKQGREHEKKYGDAQGTKEMGAEGNLWEANQQGAKESTANRPGHDQPSEGIMEKVGDVLKGASEKVAEGARKLGLKK